MKKLLVTLLALAVLVGFAVPAGAGRPPKEGKARLVVTKEAEPGYAVHAEGDVIRYTVGVELKGGDEAAPVSVKDALVSLAYVSGDDDGDAALDSGEQWVFSGSLTIGADQLALAEITNTVEVTAGDLTGSAAATVEVRPYGECEFIDGKLIPTDFPLCIWAPSQTGRWELTGVAADTGKRFGYVQLSVRDYAPGDWCGGSTDRLRPGEELTLAVALPMDGACPGDDWADANPATFYLVTIGLASVEAAKLRP